MKKMLACIGVVNCNATSGGFVKEDLRPGTYLLRVTAGTAPWQSTRDFYAPVNPGTTTYLGPLTVLIGAPVVAPDRPERDRRLEANPDESKPSRLRPGIGQPPIK